MRRGIFREIKRFLGKTPERKTLYIYKKDWSFLKISEAWYPDTTMEDRADLVLGKGLDLIKECDADRWGRK